MKFVRHTLAVMAMVGLAAFASLGSASAQTPAASTSAPLGAGIGHALDATLGSQIVGSAISIALPAVAIIGPFVLAADCWTYPGHTCGGVGSTNKVEIEEAIERPLLANAVMDKTVPEFSGVPVDLLAESHGKMIRDYNIAMGYEPSNLASAAR